MPEHPRARDTDLLSQPLGDELLVFDTVANRAHSLNATAAAVWRACDGTRDPSQIAEDCQIDRLAVELALHDLAEALLLTDYAPPAERVSRRVAIRRMALTGATLGIALPVIRSITAPSIAMAASNGRVKGKAGQHCTGNGQCSPESGCQSSLHSCQRNLSTSCAHTSSCSHGSFDAFVCRGGMCATCSSNGQCPASHPTCDVDHCV